MPARRKMANWPFYNETSNNENQLELEAGHVGLMNSPKEKGILLKEMASISTKWIHEQS
jgi:hypothetical protein